MLALDSRMNSLGCKIIWFDLKENAGCSVIMGTENSKNNMPYRKYIEIYLRTMFELAADESAVSI